MNQKAKRLLSLIMSIFMVLGCLATNMLSTVPVIGDNGILIRSTVYAEENTGNLGLQFIQAKDDLNQTASMKIEPSVKEDLEKEDLVEVMVYMNSQVETQMVANYTRASLSKAITPYQTKLQVRRNVVESLKDNAEATQNNVIKYLQKEMEKGNVKDFHSYYIVNMIYVKATKEVIENLSYMKEIEKIYKDDIIQMDEIDLPNIESSAADIEWNVSRVGADQVWDMGFDGTGIVVANIDSGVQWDHPALKEKWRGYDTTTGQIVNPNASWFDGVASEPLPTTSSDHGTHVMGTIVGGEKDGSNQVGIAPGAKWIAARVFDRMGITKNSILLAAAEWMLNPGGDPNNAPDVINNSWGGGNGINDWYRKAVQAWRAAEILPVFSAGNHREGEPEPWPGSISIPANYPESFAVGAIDKNDKLASFSKLGPSPYDTSIIKPDIVAPGVAIRSSVPGNEYGNSQGTSMSAPAVTGVVALIKSANQSLTIDQIEKLIKDTARPLTDDKYPKAPNMGYGYGLVDAFEAVSQIAGGTGFVSGTVLVPGEDKPGTILHEQKVFEIFAKAIFDVEILADIKDDVAITGVELLVKQEGESNWKEIPMEMVSGDHKDGKYRGIIRRDTFILDSTTVYRIKTKDFSGNEVITDDYNIEVKFGAIPDQYTEGFEGNVSTWKFSGTQAWEIGVPAVGPVTGPKTYDGEKVAATVLNGKYPNNADSYLISPPIDLRDENLVTASLRFYEWYDTENSWDNGYILVSNNDGESWKEVGAMRTGLKEEWTEAYINLDDYIGSTEPVFVAFRFTSDELNGDNGWYIDNFRVLGKDYDAPAAPLNLTSSTDIRGINLKWDSSTEIDFSHYNIYRSTTSNGEFAKIAEINTNSFIDSDMVNGQTYYYKISAEDFSKNEGAFSEKLSATALSISQIWGTDLEDDNGDFIDSGDNSTWQWGAPTTGPKAAASGTKLWATNLVGLYAANSNSYITSNFIDLPANSTPVLTFNHWIYMQGTASKTNDYGQVQISTDDGQTWENITPESGESIFAGKYSGSTRKWLYEEISLADYAGQNVKIRFLFCSDASTNRDGWYIDDVYITDVLDGGSYSADMSETWTTDGFKLTDDLEFTEEGELEEEELKNDDYIELSIPDLMINESYFETVDINYNTISDAEVQNIPMAFSNIPVSDAVITIVETGRSVKVDPATGKFFMRVQAGKYTLRVEAYGHIALEKEIIVVENQTANSNLILEPKPQGTIIGKIYDRYFDEPAVGAIVRLAEDIRLAPVVTDKNGEFVINNVYEGAYTLKVRGDGFESKEVAVKVIGGKTSEINIELKRFVSYDDEIIYDDGTAENALVMNESGSGLAVKFTPSQYGMVKGVNVYFWNASFPSPGGNNIGFVIYGTNENGKPYQVGETIYQNIERGVFNYIDLSSFEFVTDRDFYISTIQAASAKFSPAVGIDNNGIANDYADKSYINSEGEFIPLIEANPDKPINGGFMIRVKMEYAMETPVITNLPKLSYTNQQSIILEGKLTADGQAKIYVNDDNPIIIDPENRVFRTEIDLVQQENIIKLSGILDGIETEPSEPIIVIKDQEAPVLKITSPQEDANYNVEVAHVIGNVTDNIKLAKLEINGKEVECDENGDFYERVILSLGKNIIKVVATDMAGNTTKEERIVTAQFETSEITSVMPNTDTTLHQGDLLSVSFKATSGGQGYFKVLIPFDLSSNSIDLQNNELGIAMTEKNGVYTATWTVPSKLAATELQIQLTYVNQAGNKVTKIANAKVTVIGKIQDIASNTLIIGKEAFNINYLNNNAIAQSKLIKFLNSGQEVYIKVSDDTIVTLAGKKVTEDNLEDFIVYYDAAGNVIYFEK